MSTREQLIQRAKEAMRPELGHDVRDIAASVVDALLPQITTAEQLDQLRDGTLLVGNDWTDSATPVVFRYETSFLYHLEANQDFAADVLRHGPLTVVWQP